MDTPNKTAEGTELNAQGKDLLKTFAPDKSPKQEWLLAF